MQYGKKVYTADSVLHPEPPTQNLWANALKDDCAGLVFYRDLIMPALEIPPPPPPDD
jgi:hypothetical protein